MTKFINQQTARLVVGAILIFHIAITLHSFYGLFADYTGWTVYHGDPLAKLVFTLLWAGIFFKVRIFAFLYFSFTVLELIVKLFFGTTVFGSVFGSVFFPADVLFAFIILFLYKQYFGERSAQ